MNKYKIKFMHKMDVNCAEDCRKALIFHMTADVRKQKNKSRVKQK